MSNLPVLGDVPPNESFWTCNGVILHNIYELRSYLEGCNEYDFRYHVNNDHHKNDFSIWVRENIHDEQLARELDSELDHQRYLQKIKRRLSQLEMS